MRIGSNWAERRDGSAGGHTKPCFTPLPPESGSTPQMPTMEEKKLRVIPGLTGYRCDTENMVVYSMKKGIIRPVSPRGTYKSLSLYSDGKTYVTTLYRVVYCTRKGIDIRKIPSNFCFSYDGKDIKVCERSDVSRRAKETEKRERMLGLEQAQKEFSLIKKYIKGNHAPLLYRLNEIMKEVSVILRRRFGISEERAEMYAEIGRDRVLARIDEGGEVQLGLHRMVYTSARRAFFSQRTAEFKDYMSANIIIE